LLLPLFPVLVPLPVVVVGCVLVVPVLVVVLVDKVVVVAPVLVKVVVELVVPPLKQFDASTTLVSIVTAPVRAMARPTTAAPPVSVILVFAKILPLNAVEIAIVAETPTCQKTLHAFVPLASRTAELPAVVSVLLI